MNPEKSRTMMYAGCAGCVLGGAGVAAGGLMIAYGALYGETLLLGVGIGLCAVFVVVGIVGSLVNSVGFGQNIAERFSSGTSHRGPKA